MVVELIKDKKKIDALLTYLKGKNERGINKVMFIKMYVNIYNYIAIYI